MNKYKFWIIGISILVIIYVIFKGVGGGSANLSDQVQSEQNQPTTVQHSYSGGGANSQGGASSENHMQRIMDHLGL